MKNKKLEKLENLCHLHSKVSTICQRILRCDGNDVVLIGITGGVAAGKSTLGRYLQRYIKTTLPGKVTETIATDSFLLPNHYLEKHHLIQRKGFPETYDWQGLKDFVLAIKNRRQACFEIPIYSQRKKDILLNKRKEIKQADVYILEGVNIAFTYNTFNLWQQLDLSIYLDTNIDLAKSRAYTRFYQAYGQEKNCETSYFNRLKYFSRQQLDSYIDHLWQDINLELLKQHIVLRKQKAQIVIDSLPDLQTTNRVMVMSA